MDRSIYIGFDPREAAAFAVARFSIQRHLDQQIPIHGLVLSGLQDQGLYTRPMEHRASAAEKPIMWDVISDAPCATEFSCSRFLVPHLAKSGWALFMDCDILVRCNLRELFDSLNPSKAVYCVKHNYQPANIIKMDGQAQEKYNRKLWSSFCVFNVEHAANKALTLEYVNSVPGRVLHAFSWLKDEEIGELGQEWNWVPGHSPEVIHPRCIHYSEGGPWFPGYENVLFGKDWNEELKRWAE